jgi:hypothetical protein
LQAFIKPFSAFRPVIYFLKTGPEHHKKNHHRVFSFAAQNRISKIPDILEENRLRENPEDDDTQTHCNK